MGYRMVCPFCGLKGTVEHEYKGSANLELYRHFDTHEVCADKYERSVPNKS